MATKEQRDACLKAEADWRKANCTGQQLPPDKQAEAKALRDETHRVTWELAREQFDATEVDSTVIASDADSVTCRLPRAVLNELLIAHEAGLSDEERMAIALDTPDGMAVLKQILDLGDHLRAASKP